MVRIQYCIIHIHRHNFNVPRVTARMSAHCNINKRNQKLPLPLLNVIHIKINNNSKYSEWQSISIRIQNIIPGIASVCSVHGICCYSAQHRIGQKKMLFFFFFSGVKLCCVRRLNTRTHHRFNAIGGRYISYWGCVL